MARHWTSIRLVGILVFVCLLSAAQPAPAVATWPRRLLTWSPSSLWIPFVREGNIWLVDVAGAHERQLTFSGRAWAPFLSPDGAWVAYLVAAEAEPGAPSAAELWLAGVDGAPAVALSSGPGLVGPPAWSPDARQVAFVQDEQLAVVDLDGMQRRVLATNARLPGVGMPRPAWSPDGQRLACVLEESGQPVLALLDLNNGDREDLLIGAYHDEPYAFVPDRGIAYVQDRDVSGGDLILAIPGQESRVLVRDVVDFAWSARGDRLAVRRADGSLWVGQGDGGEQRRVAGEAGIEFWLADGSLVYRAKDGLYRVEASAETAAKLVYREDPPDLPIGTQEIVVGTLDTPWRTQFEGICGSTNCGPSSLGISMDYLGKHYTNDTIRRAINVYLRGSETSCGGGSTWSSLSWYARQRAGLATVQRSGAWSLSDITAQIAQGHPVVLLVHYRSLPGHETSPYYYDHFIVFQGIRPDGLVSYDDPAFSYASQGSNRTMTQAQLMTAWTSCVGGNPQQTAMAYYDPLMEPDRTPPDGDVTSPGQGATVNDRFVHLEGWGADAQSGFHHARLMAYRWGDWQQIGPDFTETPFSLDWNMCDSWVPDGPVSLRLEIWDHAGNQATSPRGVRQFVKAYDCAPFSAGASWEARYYAGSTCWDEADCTAVPVCSETIDGAELHQEWLSRAPCPELSGQEWVGEFSWTASLPPARYTFHWDRSSDAQLWLDGQRIADQAEQGQGPICSGSEGYTLDGETRVRLLLRGGSTDAWAHLAWSADAGACAGLPRADFDVSPLSGAAPLEVTFSNRSTGPYSSCRWQYGDSRTGDSCAAEHTYVYADPGVYTVRLAVAGSTGTDAEVKVGIVHVTGTVSFPNAALDVWPLGGPAPLYAQIRNRSSGSISACSWDFGDGSIATRCDLDQPHVYTDAGSYTIRLTVEGPGGTSTFAYPGPVQAGGSLPACIPTESQAALYADEGYSGSCVLLDTGQYADPAAIAPLGDDDVESIRVGSSVQALLYENSGYEGRSEILSGYDSDLADNELGSNALSSIRVQPRDTELPLVAWVAPVTRAMVYTVESQLLPLEASAVDNLAVARVRFYRWDHPQQQFHEIGSADAAPYRVHLDSTRLSEGWNQVLVEAYDVSDNRSTWDWIWLARESQPPDLVPYTPAGYADAVVASPVAGTAARGMLPAGQPTYLRWRVANEGGGPAPAGFAVELWVDGVRVSRQSVTGLAPGETVEREGGTYTVSAPGWHTVRLIVDPDQAVAESDESNNVWERTFYWAASAPFTDDMEHGTENWSATGLWHLVDESSSYGRYHSGTHGWWYGQESSGSYDTGAANSGDLTLQPFYLPSPGIWLRFWYRYETETRWREWDRRVVQISVDGRPFGDLLHLYDDPTHFWLQSQAIDLSAYAGHVVQLRFHMDTMDERANGYRGWYVDDVSLTTTAPTSCGNLHEPNDTAASAVPLAYGQTVRAEICPGGDYDFYRFIGRVWDRVTLDVDSRVDGSVLDGYLFLLASDGVTVLAESDDEVLEEVQDPYLVYRLPYDGIYYIKMRAWDHPSVGSTEHYYDLRLAGELSPLTERVYLPSIMRNP